MKDRPTPQPRDESAQGPESRTDPPGSTLAIVLDLTRIAEPDDPHAFRFEPQGYTLRGPTGGLERFDIPWSAELLADLDAFRRPGRDPAVVQRVGEVMQRALRPISWTGLGEQIRAASEAGRPVVVTLRSNAAELYALPWELLTVGASGQHLGELAGVAAWLGIQRSQLTRWRERYGKVNEHNGWTPRDLWLLEW